MVEDLRVRLVVDEIVMELEDDVEKTQMSNGQVKSSPCPQNQHFVSPKIAHFPHRTSRSATLQTQSLPKLRSLPNDMLQLNTRPNKRLYLLAHMCALLKRIRKPNQRLLTPIPARKRQSKRYPRRRRIQIAPSIRNDRLVSGKTTQRHCNNRRADNR
jgi:hypothetical protein